MTKLHGRKIVVLSSLLLSDMLQLFKTASAVILALMCLGGETVSAQDITPMETSRLPFQHSNPENIPIPPPPNLRTIQVSKEGQAAGDTIVRYNQVLLKADTAYLSGDYSTAISAYQEALRLSPDNQLLYQKLGEAYFSAGEDEEALVTFKTYLKKSTLASARIHYVLGVLLERQGNIDEALNEYNSAMTIDPIHSGARRRRADIYLIRGELKKAINEYQILHKTSPNNPILLYKLARTYVKDKQFDRALETYRQAINLDGANIEIQREHALLLKQLGHYHEAEAVYSAILEKQPDDEVALNGIIFVYVKQKKYEGLTSFLEKQQERDANNPDHPYRLGLIYEYRRMFPEALDAYKRSLNVKTSAKVYRALGRVLLKTGKKAEAKTALEAARKIDPKAPEVRNLLMQLKAENRVQNLKKHKKKSSKSKKKKRKTKQVTTKTSAKPTKTVKMRSKKQ